MKGIGLFLLIWQGKRLLELERMNKTYCAPGPDEPAGKKLPINGRKAVALERVVDSDSRRCSGFFLFSFRLSKLCADGQRSSEGEDCSLPYCCCCCPSPQFLLQLHLLWPAWTSDVSVCWPSWRMCSGV